MNGSFAAKAVASLALAAFFIAPTSSIAQCSTNCAVGALGTGGQSSGGAAQGFLVITPSSSGLFNVKNSGNFDAGGVVVYDLDGDVVGTLDGTYRDEICRGRETGIFSDSHGFDIC